MGQDKKVCACGYMCICYNVQLFCNPMDCSPPDSSVHGNPRWEYWNGLPLPSPGDLPDPGIKTHVSCIGRQILYHWATREALGMTLARGKIGLYPHNRKSEHVSLPPGTVCPSLRSLEESRIVPLQMLPVTILHLVLPQGHVRKLATQLEQTL